MSRHLPFCGDCNCWGCADTNSYTKKEKVATMTDGLVIHNAIIDKMSFEQWYNSGRLSGRLNMGKNNAYVSIGDKTALVEVVESDAEDGSDSYGEPYQGWTGEASLVFKVLDNGQPRFFKKLGTVDSYSGISWDGRFAEVFPTEKTTTIYEYKESK